VSILCSDISHKLRLPDWYLCFLSVLLQAQTTASEWDAYSGPSHDLVGLTSCCCFFGPSIWFYISWFASWSSLAAWDQPPTWETPSRPPAIQVEMPTNHFHWLLPLTTSTDYSHWLLPLTPTEFSYWLLPLTSPTDSSYWLLPLTPPTDPPLRNPLIKHLDRYIAANPVCVDAAVTELLSLFSDYHLCTTAPPHTAAVKSSKRQLLLSIFWLRSPKMCSSKMWDVEQNRDKETSAAGGGADMWLSTATCLSGCRCRRRHSEQTDGRGGADGKLTRNKRWSRWGRTTKRRPRGRCSASPCSHCSWLGKGEFNSIQFICIAQFHELQICLGVLYNLYT